MPATHVRLVAAVRRREGQQCFRAPGPMVSAEPQGPWLSKPARHRLPWRELAVTRRARYRRTVQTGIAIEVFRFAQVASCSNRLLRHAGCPERVRTGQPSHGSAGEVLRRVMFPRPLRLAVLTYRYMRDADRIVFLAEEVGFEPTDGRPSLVFKTSAFNRSATLPKVAFKVHPGLVPNYP
jgi:hypothetical protein